VMTAGILMRPCVQPVRMHSSPVLQLSVGVSVSVSVSVFVCPPKEQGFGNSVVRVSNFCRASRSQLHCSCLTGSVEQLLPAPENMQQLQLASKQAAAQSRWQLPLDAEKINFAVHVCCLCECEMRMCGEAKFEIFCSSSQNE